MKIGSTVLGCSFLLLGLAVSVGQNPPPLSNNIPNPKIAPTAGNVNPADNSIKSGNMGKPDLDNSDTDLDTLRRERFTKAISLEYQKKNRADSARLVELAKDLNEEYSTPGSTGSGADDLNKAKEIEKLAKRMKQRLTQIP